MKNPIDYDFKIRIIPSLLREYGFHTGCLYSFIIQRSGTNGYAKETEERYTIPLFHFNFISYPEYYLEDIEAVTVKDSTVIVDPTKFSEKVWKETFFHAPMTVAKWDGLIPAVILGSTMSRFLYLQEEEDWAPDERLSLDVQELSNMLDLRLPSVITGIAILRDLELMYPSRKYHIFNFRNIRFYIKELKREPLK